MPINIPFKANPTFTWDRGDPRTFIMRLTGNVLSSVFDMSVSPPANTTFIFVLIQDAVGGRTFAWPSICRGAPAIGDSPNQTTVQEFILTDGPVLTPISSPMYA